MCMNMRNNPTLQNIRKYAFIAVLRSTTTVGFTLVMTTERSLESCQNAYLVPNMPGVVRFRVTLTHSILRV
jgi:hypothetical protein